MLKKISAVAAAVALAVSPVVAQTPALSMIGTAAAVSGAVKAAAQGTAVGRVISSGKPLYLNDHVTTDAAGRLQVLLLDETIFTLGPNSDMVLDEFVYDPKTAGGKVSATIAKGSFRFVTGKVARKDPANMKVKLAVGTIGVRGSIGVGETGPEGSLVINGGARNADDHEDNAGIYASSKGRTVNLIQPGAGVRIGPGGDISAAALMRDELNRVMGGLQGRTAARGGVGAGVMTGGGDDPSQRRTSSAGGTAGDTAGLVALGSSVDNTLTNASQMIGNGVTTWDEIRQITTGMGSYTSPTGSYSCTGGVCSSGATGTLSFTQTVDFANQKITAITISLGGTISDTGSLSAPIFYTVASGATGQAKVTLTNSEETSGLGGHFANTTVTFQDRAGTVAKDAVLNLHYLDSFNTATAVGTVTGSR